MALTRPRPSSTSASAFSNRETFQPFGTVSAMSPLRRCTGRGVKPHRPSRAGLRLRSRSRDSTDGCRNTVPAIAARRMAATGKSSRPAPRRLRSSARSAPSGSASRASSRRRSSGRVSTSARERSMRDPGAMMDSSGEQDLVAQSSCHAAPAPSRPEHPGAPHRAPFRVRGMRRRPGWARKAASPENGAMRPVGDGKGVRIAHFRVKGIRHPLKSHCGSICYELRKSLGKKSARALTPMKTGLRGTESPTGPAVKRNAIGRRAPVASVMRPHDGRGSGRRPGRFRRPARSRPVHGPRVSRGRASRTRSSSLSAGPPPAASAA